jgi:hemerythrin superfamily protein
VGHKRNKSGNQKVPDQKKKKYKEINETKSWFLEKNKIGRLLENLTKRRREKPKSVKSEMQRGR